MWKASTRSVFTRKLRRLPYAASSRAEDAKASDVAASLAQLQHDLMSSFFESFFDSIFDSIVHGRLVSSG